MDSTPAQPSSSQPTEPTVKNLSGFDEGTVLPDGSIIKGSYDEQGKLVGWHKEPAQGGAQ
jgi:hypothetical protein